MAHWDPESSLPKDGAILTTKAFSGLGKADLKKLLHHLASSFTRLPSWVLFLLEYRFSERACFYPLDDQANKAEDNIIGKVKRNKIYQIPENKN